MTKVKITGLKKDSRRLRNQILQAVDDSNFAKSLNTALRARIRKSGIAPALSPRTREFRSRVSSRKGPGFSPYKSSLTLSGQLLGAMITIFKKGKAGFFRTTKSEFIFDVKDQNHRGYKIQRKLKKADSFSLSSPLANPRSKTRFKRELSKQDPVGKGKSLKEIWDINMRTRPVTRIFDQYSFRLRIERRLVSAIKRYIK